MKQELWLSRDDTKIGHYNIHSSEPIRTTGAPCFWRDIIYFFDTYRFHALFNARLRKGRKKRIKRILIELED